MKIGVTVDLAKRLETIQAGNHLELNYLACIPCNTHHDVVTLERQLHKYFSHCKIREDWYRGDKISFDRLKLFGKRPLEIIEPATTN